MISPFLAFEQLRGALSPDGYARSDADLTAFLARTAIADRDATETIADEVRTPPRAA